MHLQLAKQELKEKGYSVLESVYTSSEVNNIKSIINNIDSNGISCNETKGLFAIRKLLIISPELKEFLFNGNFKSIIRYIGSDDYFITKAIYFDKPSESNWFVPFHQDISISSSNKANIKGYKNWTLKKGQYGVQPPVEILESIFTVRIHLDNTTKENGALKVLANSHKKGIVRNDNPLLDKKIFIFSPVNAGGVMLMKPLLFHASNRTINNKRRRVIHLEFSNKELKEPLEWLEKINLQTPLL